MDSESTEGSLTVAWGVRAVFDVATIPANPAKQRFFNVGICGNLRTMMT